MERNEHYVSIRKSKRERDRERERKKKEERNIKEQRGGERSRN